MSFDLVNSLGTETSTSYQYQSSVMEQENFQLSLQNAIDNGSDEDLKEACCEFEAYFLNLMLSSMRATVIEDENSWFAKSDGEKMFQDLLDEEVTKQVAFSSNGLGLADMMYNQLSYTAYNGQEVLASMYEAGATSTYTNPSTSTSDNTVATGTADFSI